MAELTTTILTPDEVHDLVERMLRTSGRRVDHSSPFVDGYLRPGDDRHPLVSVRARDAYVVGDETSTTDGLRWVTVQLIMMAAPGKGPGGYHISGPAPADVLRDGSESDVGTPTMGGTVESVGVRLDTVQSAIGAIRDRATVTLVMVSRPA